VKYDPFGARVSPTDPYVLVSQSPDDLRAGFTGHEHDDDLGFIDMIGRVYDPAQQRFLSQDPPAPVPTDSQSLNPYAYVRNNPLNATDPTGYLEALLDNFFPIHINDSGFGPAFRGPGFEFGYTITIPYGSLPGETQGVTGTAGPGSVGQYNLGDYASKLSVGWAGLQAGDLVTGEDGSPPVSNEELFALLEKVLQQTRTSPAPDTQRRSPQPVRGRVYEQVSTNPDATESERARARQTGEHRSGEQIMGPPTERDVHPGFHPGGVAKFADDALGPIVTPSPDDTTAEKVYKWVNRKTWWPYAEKAANKADEGWEILVPPRWRR
jgi:RHS repeat-associated protein